MNMNYTTMTPEEILEIIQSELNSVNCAMSNKISAEQFLTQAQERLHAAQLAYLKAIDPDCSL